MSKLTLSKLLLSWNLNHLEKKSLLHIIRTTWIFKVPCSRFCFKGTIPENEVFSLAIEISIIAQVIIKMHVLWLIKNCIIFCNNRLARGNYSRGARSRNGCFRLWHNTQEAINAMEENTILKNKMTLQSLAQQLS